MKRLKVVDMGTEVQGIKLEGDKRNPEPEHVRIMFPGGDVDVVRCDDGSYWVHVRVDRDDICHVPGRQSGKIVDARLDIVDKHASETDAGDFANPGLYHLAVRVTNLSPMSRRPK